MHQMRRVRHGVPLPRGQGGLGEMETKKYMTIDGLPVEINGEKNILEVIRKAGIKPVSYTHLDVYKRQPAACMRPARWPPCSKTR